MTQWLDTQLILALAIVILAIAAFGYLISAKVAAVGLLRHNFGWRAPWLAVGAIIGGVILYYVKR
jgi:hypothetical protein